MNKAAALPLVLILFVTLFEAATLQVKGEPKTIVVVGDWMRIQGAISSASPGDTILVKKGTYDERRLVIDKAVTLVGEDPNGTVITNSEVPQWDFSFPPPPSTVAFQISANNVKVTGFTITGMSGMLGIVGGGDGIQIVGNTIENNVDLNGNNQLIAGNKATASFLCSGSYNNISANKIIGNHQGIVMEGASNIVEDNILTGGSDLQVSGDNNSVSKNNVNNSVLSIGGSFNVVFTNLVAGNLAIVGNNNTFFGNYIQGVWMGSTLADVVNNLFYHNNFNFTENSVIPAGEKTFGIWSGVHGPVYLDNGKEGNWWSDYSGNDTDGDGIGETPYVIYANDSRNYHYVADFDISNIILTDNHPLMFPFDIENGSVVVPTVEPANSDSSFGTAFPTLPILAVSVVVAAVVAVSAVVYLKKRNR